MPLGSSDGRDGDLRYFGRTEQKQRHYRRVRIAVSYKPHLGKPLSEVTSVPRKLTHTPSPCYTVNNEKKEEKARIYTLIVITLHRQREFFSAKLTPLFQGSISELELQVNLDFRRQ